MIQQRNKTPAISCKPGPYTDALVFFTEMHGRVPQKTCPALCKLKHCFEKAKYYVHIIIQNALNKENTWANNNYLRDSLLT